MKNPIMIVVTFFLVTVSYATYGQTGNTLSKTPEQEALKQTEKLHQEIGLSTDQYAKIYDINLRYARIRQTSNSRSEALEHVKNKKQEINLVLTYNQKLYLESKRYVRNSVIKVIKSKSPVAPSQVPDSKSSTKPANSQNKKFSAPPSPEYQEKYSNGPQNASETRLP
jgi:hypothetical protein